jgi:hypothetical protein
MRTMKAATMMSIALGLGLIVSVSIAEAGRGGGGFRGGSGFRGGGGSIYIPSGGGGFHGSSFRGGGGGYVMRGGGASFQRGGSISMRSGGSYIRHGGGSWRGSHSIYRTPRHLGSYDRSARRYAYNAWRGDIGGRRGSFRHGKRFRHDEFAFRHGKRFRHHDFDRRHHRRFRRFVGYGFPYYDDYGYYAGGCGWLYRRALITRSPYWWNRYYACINYNY